MATVATVAGGVDVHSIPVQFVVGLGWTGQACFECGRIGDDPSPWTLWTLKRLIWNTLTFFHYRNLSKKGVLMSIMSIT